MAHMYVADGPARLIPGATIHITGDEAKHAARVARLRVGERVSVTDTRGTVATVEAIAVAPDHIDAVVIDVTTHPQPTTPIWLVQALAKAGRDEQAIEQSVELGVSRVIPWQAARSVVVWRDGKEEKGHARWSRIVQEASKQSLQPWWATVSPLHHTADVSALTQSASVVVLDPDSPDLLTDVVVDLPAARPIALVVGPEGGVSDEERDLLVASGAITGRMGPTVLRTSTAGPVAIALTMSTRGMWQTQPPSGQDL